MLRLLSFLYIFFYFSFFFVRRMLCIFFFTNAFCHHKNTASNQINNDCRPLVYFKCIHAKALLYPNFASYKNK